MHAKGCLVFTVAQEEGWDLADQRELYEVQWTLFASNKSPERKITFSDVPWPGISTSPADIMRVVLYGATVSSHCFVPPLPWLPSTHVGLC